MPEEKIFTIPLRRAWRTERTRRAKKAIDLIRQFLERHMKSQDVKIGSSINGSVWSRGIQKPPRRVRVHALTEDNVTYAELVGVELKLPSKEEVKEKKEKISKKAAKIKEERKERKKRTKQEELEEEVGKKEEKVEKVTEVKEGE